MYTAALYKVPSTVNANDDRVDGQAVTGTGTYYSNVFSGRDNNGWFLDLRWTGTPTGVFSIWYAAKPDPDLTNDNDWTQDVGITITQPAGAAGKSNVAVQNTQHSRLKRLKYVNASGSGVIFGYANVSA